MLVSERRPLAYDHLALEDLRRQLQTAMDSWASGDVGARAQAEADIPSLMRRMADAQPDNAKRDEWYARAREWEGGDGIRKHTLTKDLGIGLGVLVASPLIVAGGILYGTGKMVHGMGRKLSWSGGKTAMPEGFDEVGPLLGLTPHQSAG
jgi:hypothetical protein